MDAAPAAPAARIAADRSARVSPRTAAALAAALALALALAGIGCAAPLASESIDGAAPLVADETTAFRLVGYGQGFELVGAAGSQRGHETSVWFIRTGDDVVLCAAPRAADPSCRPVTWRDPPGDLLARFVDPVVQGWILLRNAPPGPGSPLQGGGAPGRTLSLSDHGVWLLSAGLYRCADAGGAVACELVRHEGAPLEFGRILSHEVVPAGAGQREDVLWMVASERRVLRCAAREGRPVSCAMASYAAPTDERIGR